MLVKLLRWQELPKKLYIDPLRDITRVFFSWYFINTNSVNTLELSVGIELQCR